MIFSHSADRASATCRMDARIDPRPFSSLGEFLGREGMGSGRQTGGERRRRIYGGTLTRDRAPGNNNHFPSSHCAANTRRAIRADDMGMSPPLGSTALRQNEWSINGKDTPAILLSRATAS